jgi:hypothetical protein
MASIVKLSSFLLERFVRRRRRMRNIGALWGGPGTLGLETSNGFHAAELNAVFARWGGSGDN